MLEGVFEVVFVVVLVVVLEVVFVVVPEEEPPLRTTLSIVTPSSCGHQIIALTVAPTLAGMS